MNGYYLGVDEHQIIRQKPAVKFKLYTQLSRPSKTILESPERQIEFITIIQPMVE